MFKDPIRLLLNVAAGLAVVGYLVALVMLGVKEWRATLNPDAVRIVSGVVTSVGGVLATFFGAVIGLSRAAAAANGQTTGPLARAVKLNTFQVVAAWFYFISLVVALALWGRDGFGKETPEAVSSLGLTLFGVLGGILTIVLSVDHPNGGGNTAGNGS